MRRANLVQFLALITVLVSIAQEAQTLDTSLTTTFSVTATSLFSMEFYVDEKVIYTTTVPFSNVDSSQPLVYPNGRRQNDGKSDTGVVCTSNLGAPWYLQIQARFSEGMPEDSLKFYYDQPWNRNTGVQTNGGLTYTPQWRPLPEEPTTIYTSGSNDTTNTPFGTLSTFNFALDPRGLSSERTYTVSVTYTMTTAP